MWLWKKSCVACIMLQVACAYHGWKFDADGQCTEMPSTAFCRNVAVAALPCSERDGLIWVWPGDGVPPEVRCPVSVSCFWLRKEAIYTVWPNICVLSEMK